MIEVENLTKRYGRHTAVDAICFKVEKGEILGFLGPNGAGKTTPMRVLTCYLPPTEGTARVAGHDVFREPMEVKKRTGYIPETPPLYPDMEGQEFLHFCGKIKGGAPKERGARGDEAIGKGRIGDVRGTLIGPEVSKTCGRVVIINKGRVVAEDTPHNLTHRLKGAGTFRLEVRGEQGPAFDVLRGVPGVARIHPKSDGPGVAVFEVEAEAGKDIRADLAWALVTKGFGLLGLQQVGMSLEEIFLHLTTTDTVEEPSAPAASEVTA